LSHVMCPAAVNGPSLTNGDYRHYRHIKRNLRLLRQIRDLINAYPSGKYIGGNEPVETLARQLGFEPHDLAIADARVDRRILTLICVPHHIFKQPHRLSHAIELRSLSRQAGFSAVIVPQGFVEREPRLGNAQLMAGTARIKVDATTRMTVLAYLIENGGCCLSEIAALIEHPDPFGAVLQLAGTGAVSIDMSASISPYSVVDVASPPAARH
jgi:hypothetical protein